MLDPIALIEVQRATRDLAQGARPESPVRPDPVREPSGDRWAPIRLRLSQELRRIADLVDPEPVCGAPATERR